MYGYLLDIKIAANSPFFSGIVLASSWHVGIVCGIVFGIVCGIVLASFGHRFGFVTVTASHQEQERQQLNKGPATTEAAPATSQPSTTKATSDKACTDYSSVPTKPQHHTRHESSCTAATEQSFSSLVWTVSTIHTAAHISTPVTGHHVGRRRP